MYVSATNLSLAISSLASVITLAHSFLVADEAPQYPGRIFLELPQSKKLLCRFLFTALGATMSARTFDAQDYTAQAQSL